MYNLIFMYKLYCKLSGWSVHEVEQNSAAVYDGSVRVNINTPLHRLLHLYEVDLYHIDGLVQERCNSIANTLELHLSCTKTLIWCQPILSLPALDSDYAETNVKNVFYNFNITGRMFSDTISSQDLWAVYGISDEISHITMGPHSFMSIQAA